MSQTVKSPILDPSGVRADASVHWRVPGGQSPYFGWMGQDGFTTLKIDEVVAMWPNPQISSRYQLALKNGSQMSINDQDALRLMKRMGWIEPGEIKH
jgi:hypothetical protein